MYRRCIANTRFKEEDLEALVARCRAGDEEAWASLWLALAPLVENVARRRLPWSDPRWSGSVTDSQRKIDQRA